MIIKWFDTKYQILLLLMLNQERFKMIMLLFIYSFVYNSEFFQKSNNQITILLAINVLNTQ